MQDSDYLFYVLDLIHIFFGNTHAAQAAVAYNKAASTLLKKGYERNYPVNYLETLYGDEYKTMFKKLTISKTIRELPECTKPHN